MGDSKRELTLDDLNKHPVWYFDTDTELFRPLTDLDDPIGSVEELHFRATFTTPAGHELSGSITGKGTVAIGIFRNGRWYAANKNWKQTSIEQLSQLLIDSPDLKLSDIRQLLPLKFETRINKEPFIDRSGSFDLV